MIVKSIYLTEGDHIFLQVNDTMSVDQVKQILHENMGTFASCGNDVYSYPPEKCVRVLIPIRNTRGTGFAATITALANAEVAA